MRMDPKPFCLGLSLFLNVVITVAAKRPRQAFANQYGAQVLTAYCANGNGTPVLIGASALANDILASYEFLQPSRRHTARGPSIRADLAALWSVNTPKAISLAVHAKRVTVGDYLR